MDEPDSWAWYVEHAHKATEDDLDRRVFAISPRRIIAADTEIGRLRAALAFAASCIKAGEPWTPTCEEIIGGALKGGK